MRIKTSCLGGGLFYLILIILGSFLIFSEGVSINIFTAWNLTPLIVSFALYSYAKKKGKHLFGAYGFLIGSMLVSGYIHLAWMFDWGGTATGSSTSALIFIFIPVYSVIAGLMGLAVGIGLHHRVSRPYVALAVILSIFFVAYQLISAVKLAPTITEITQMDDAQLSSLLDNDPNRNNRYVLGAIASNKSASATTLARIAALEDSSLHESYGCHGIVDLCGGNTNGRAVMVKVAYHRNLSADTLPRLAQSSNGYVLEAVAKNPESTRAVLQDIYQRRDQYQGMTQRIETSLAYNEATPQFILRELSYDSQAYGRTLKGIVHNASATEDIKKHVMGRIDRCEYEIVDYPFTKCVPNATDWESGNKASEKKKKNNVSKCYYYYKNKQYKKAFDSCTDEANIGKAHAQYNLAHLYRTGKAGIQDKEKAVEYYQLAAEQGYGEAQFSLGIMYFQGSGTAVDMEKARYWWEKSETNGISSTRVKKALKRIPQENK